MSWAGVRTLLPKGSLQLIVDKSDVVQSYGSSHVSHVSSRMHLPLAVCVDCVAIHNQDPLLFPRPSLGRLLFTLIMLTIVFLLGMAKSWFLQTWSAPNCLKSGSREPKD